MNSIKLNPITTMRSKSEPFRFSPAMILNKYLDYAADQEDSIMYWYLKCLIVLPGCIMVPSIIFMEMTTSNYVWFIGLTVVIFFANIIVHISELKSTVIIPVYHLSIAVMAIIPLISYLINA